MQVDIPGKDRRYVTSHSGFLFPVFMVPVGIRLEAKSVPRILGYMYDDRVGMMFELSKFQNNLDDGGADNKNRQILGQYKVDE